MNIRMNTKRHARRLTAAALFFAPVALIGCTTSSGPHHAGDIGSIRSNPSPAMHTIDGRLDDRLNRMTRANDTNFRAFSDDIDRLFMIDRPSRLRPGIKP